MRTSYFFKIISLVVFDSLTYFEEAFHVKKY